jgi:hypothetical protein
MEHIQMIPDTNDVKAAVRVGLSVGLPLAAVYAAGRLDLAVFAAFGGLASLYGHSESGKKRIETQIVAALVLVAMIALASVYAASQAGEWVLAALLAAVVVGTGSLGAVMGWVPRGEIFFVLVLLIVASLPMDWAKVPVAIAVGAASAAVCVVFSLFANTEQQDTHSTVSRLRTRVATGTTLLDARRHTVAILITTVAILAAWMLAGLLGIGHSFWAPVAVAAVMPALGSTQVKRRMVHLIAGTAGGVAMAAMLFAFSPNHLALVTIIVVCQTAAELFVARQFGVSLLFLCPLAIAMSNITRGLPWLPLITERFVETVLGAVVATVMILVGTRILPKAKTT